MGLEVHVLPTPQKVARAAAEWIAALSNQQIQSEGRFTVALAGGSTPRRLYQVLASPAYAGRMGWDRWHIFWGDERCVPPDHPESNYRMAKESLLDHVPVPADHIHRVRGETTPQNAAEEYEQQVLQLFSSSTPSFDLVLLGIGDDGHTASLFPGSSALHEKRQLVVATWVPHLQAHRITFTLPLINAASAIAFLATDESKAKVVRQVLQPAPGDATPPAALVRPTSGTSHWFLTKAAASQLQEIRA